MDVNAGSEGVKGNPDVTIDGKAIVDGETPATDIESQRADQAGSGQAEVEAQEAGSLFDDEVKPTYEQLTGEKDNSPGDGSSGDPDSSQGKADGKTDKGEADKGGADKGKAKEGEASQDADKIPPGLVKIQALHDERYKRQSAVHQLTQAQARISELESIIEEGRQPGEDGELKDFKVLSQAEVDELAEDDPAEAAKYLSRLHRYQTLEQQKRDRERISAEAKQQKETLVSEATREIEAAVPGIYDSNNEIGSKLTQFASDRGLSPQIISLISDPNTVLIPPGSNQPMILGKGASQVVSMIYSVYQQLQNTDPTALRSQIESELTQKIKAAAAAEFTQKLKTGDAIKPGLGDIPSASENSLASAPIGEEAWAKMSKEARTKALGG